MKKYSWIVALLLALSLAFFACDNGGGKEPEPEGEMEWKTVWEMAADAGIQALTAGVLTFGTGDAGNPIKPLVRAGGDDAVTIEALKVDGKTSLKFATAANWGAGLDLSNAAFGFQGGDKITITGEFLSGEGRTQINFSVGSENANGTEIKAPGPISWDIELTAAQASAIKTLSPPALRIEGRPGEIVVRIDNIKIEGNRAKNEVKLATPVITLDGTTVSWDKIEGAGKYKLLAVAEGETEAVTVTEPGAEATSYNLAVSTLKPTKYTETAVKYSITLIAVGVTGASTDSAPSNAVDFTKQPPAPPPLVKIKIGTEQDAELYAISGTFVNIYDETEITKVIGYTFTNGDEYGNSYAYLKIDLGAGKSLKDFSQVKVTYQGVSGDISYKDLELRVSATEFSGELTGASLVNKKRFDDWASINASNTSANGKLAFGTGPQMNGTTATNTTLNIDPDLAAAITGNEVFVSIRIGVEADTVYSISNIEFVPAATTAFTHSVYFVTTTGDLLLAYITNVTHNSALVIPTLPDSNAKMAANHATFVADGTITGWKKADGTTVTVGTTTVTNDLILYAQQ